MGDRLKKGGIAMLRTLTYVLGLLGAWPLAASAEVWFVDQNGAGHFREIDAAVQAASPGDVLVVQPGTYRSFVLSKQLTILGAVGGVSTVRVKGRTQVEFAPGFVLAGLEFAGLYVTDVPGLGRMDDCTVGVWDHHVIGASKVALRVIRAGQLLVTRSVVEGYDGDDIGHGGRRGMVVSESNAVLVDCVVVGGMGESHLYGGDDGGDGLTVRDGSHVLLAGCAGVSGGLGGWASPFCGCDGDGGDAIVAVDATVVVRGATGDFVVGASGQYGGASGRAVVSVSSTVVLSGVTIWGALVGSGIVLPPRAEPFLEVTGQGLPGGGKVVEVYGPPDRTALVGFSLTPALLTLPGFDGQLWLDPALLWTVLPVRLLGQDTPARIELRIPPHPVLDVPLLIQPAFPDLSGTFDPSLGLLGNPDHVVVRLPAW